jgi:hypothetical protein
MTKAKNRLVTHTLTTIRLASATSISLILGKAAIRHASLQTRLAKLAARRDGSDWQRLCELVKSFKNCNGCCRPQPTDRAARRRSPATSSTSAARRLRELRPRWRTSDGGRCARP